MDLRAQRGNLHSEAGRLHGAADPVTGFQAPLVPPDAGESSGLLAELLSEVSMATANYIEFVSRASSDLAACAATYDGTEDDNTHAFDNLKAVDPPKLPAVPDGGAK